MILLLLMIILISLGCSFLQDKSETQEVLKEFLKRAVNKFDANVKKIRSDNGTEFTNTQVEDFLDDEGYQA
jgi:IS30 family transposase